MVGLRNFSRLDESEQKEVDLHDGLDSTLLLLQNRLAATTERPAIAILRDYHLPTTVECYPGQLNQVFFNLLTNAIDALESVATNGTPTIQIHTHQDAQHAVIRIIDNGPGLAPATQGKIFDPFFTTKAVGKGTGLGLSISHSVVVGQHQGELDCVSGAGEGTEFIIKIPIRAAKSGPNVQV